MSEAAWGICVAIVIGAVIVSVYIADLAAKLDKRLHIIADRLSDIQDRLDR